MLERMFPSAYSERFDSPRQMVSAKGLKETSND